MFQQKQAVKSPIPNQKQTKPTPQKTQHQTGTIQKLQRFKPPTPTRRGKTGPMKTYVKHENHTPRTPNQNNDAIHQWNSTTPPPAHTQTGTHHTVHEKAGKHTHATKVHWHTIEFSNNTSTPTSQNHNTIPTEQAASQEATHRSNQKSNPNSTPVHLNGNPYSLKPFPLTDQSHSEATDGYITTNHKPTQTPRQEGVSGLGVDVVKRIATRVSPPRSSSCRGAARATCRAGSPAPPAPMPRLGCERCSRRHHLP